MSPPLLLSAFPEEWLCLMFRLPRC
jgi:hypothetical protein